MEFLQIMTSIYAYNIPVLADGGFCTLLQCMVRVVKSHLRSSLGPHQLIGWNAGSWSLGELGDYTCTSCGVSTSMYPFHTDNGLFTLAAAMVDNPGPFPT